MPFPRRLLKSHEEVVADLHPHWWYYAKPTAALVGAIAMGILTLTLDDGSVRTALTWLSIAVIGAAVSWTVLRYATWATTHFVVTSDRVIFRTGIVAKSGIEIPLERVNTVHFSQSILERMVGAGDLVIESGAEDGQQRFTDIRNPDGVQREIHVQKVERERRRLGDSLSQQRPGVADQLEKLEGMLDRGTLTPEEFQMQKRRLLDE